MRRVDYMVFNPVKRVKGEQTFLKIYIFIESNDIV